MMLLTSKKLRLLLLGSLFLIPALIFSQGTASIKGKVLDEDTDEPLIGATVIVAGTSSGTITDFDGNYVIAGLPAGEHKVEFTYTGFAKTIETITLSAGQELSLDMTMGVSATELDVIVVTGTGGPVEKKKIGNTIGSISTKKLQNVPINSFSDLLTGREPGIVALPSGGLTGEGTQIRIRGSASLSQLNEPIVIIDGIRVDNGGGFGAGGFASAGGGGAPSRLDDINPESIERIEILKGASAATLFGTEASNGVIQIFTKKGVSGKPQVDLKFAQGIMDYPNRFQDNVGFARTASQAQALSSFYGEDIKAYDLIRRNFTEELFETGFSNNASASVSGGNNLISYYVSGRYFYQDGPFGGQDRNYPAGITTQATDTDRKGQLNVNLNIFPSEKFNFRITSGYSNTAFTTLQTNNNIYGVGSLAQFSKPELAGPNNQTGTIAFATVNEALQLSVSQDVRHYNGSIAMNYYPKDWLKLDAVFGVDYSNQGSVEFTPFGWNIDGFASNNASGQKDYTDRNFTAISAEVKATMNHQITPNISSNLILGGQLIRQEELIQSGSGTDFPGPGFEISSAAANQQLFEFFSEVINAGVFVQEQVGFSDQFFLTLGARLDGHSAFGSNFNAAVYPKVSFSYIPSDADWWNDIGPISSLQLRSSYGWAGLQPGAFDALTTYQALTSTSGAGIVPNNLGNADLEPEISKEWEIGTVVGLFNDKVSVEAVYWDRTVEDALFARQFALSGGWRSRQLVNIGELSANGVELKVNGTVYRSRDWSVELFANAAYIKEEVVSLGGAPPVKVGGSYPRYRNFLIEGFAPGAQFGAELVETTGDALPIDFNSDGLPDSRDEIVAFLGSKEPGDISLPTTIGAGGVLLKDEDGDGDFLDHYLGKGVPDWQGSFGGTVKFRNFSLTTLFEYKTGNFRINNLTGAFRQANASIGRNLPGSAEVERDYLSGGTDGQGNAQNSGEVRYEALKGWLFENLALAPFSGLNTIEKADFIRWRELNVTYQIPTSFLKKLNLRNASFTVAGRNLALFSGYGGVDPEINVFGRGGDGDESDTTDQNFGVGIEAFGWPIPRQLMFTLKVGI
ncbi:MAG: SusC/RagA family TonB-linked outer membrane protein [Saprospiraceae bacterium]|nr:SusC/RagA family TonB-linked outer membrane protein [Saprospiraceae bacterium]